MAYITILAIFFSAGIAIAFTNLNSSIFAVTFLLIFIFSLLVALISKYRKNKILVPGIICFASLGLFLGIIRGQVAEEIFTPEEFYGKHTFMAEVITVPYKKDTVQKFVVNLLNANSASNERTDYNILINASLYPVYSPGDILEITGNIKSGETILPIPPENYKSFDYDSYLSEKNIIGSVSFPKITTAGNNKSFLYSLFNFRKKITSLIDYKINYPESALINGVVFGVDSLPKEVEEGVKISGLSHIIVLSGFNLAIIIGFILYIFKNTPLTFRIVASLLFVFLFVLMVGPTPSLLRAAIMAYVALFALFLGKEYYALESLMFAVLLYGIFSPLSILNSASLHLSFLATLGLILLYNPIEKFVSNYFNNSFIKGVISATFAATIMTTPYLIYNFAEFSLYGILGNLLVVPIIPLLMLLTIIFIITAWIPLLSQIISFLVYLISTYILKTSSIVSSLPFSKVGVNISIFTTIVIYLLIFSIIAYLKKYKGSSNKNLEDNLVSF